VAGLGQCPTSGITNATQGRLELFVDGQAGVLARWPNIDSTTGYWQWSNIAKVKRGRRLAGGAWHAAV
jgi:hypothetical protein